MNVVITIITICVLGIVAFQDFRYRAIFWITIPFLFIAFTVQSILQNGIKSTSLFFLVNLCFTVFIFTAGALLVAIPKKQPLGKVLKTFAGMGDLLFFLALCTAFSPFMYLTYCGISTIAAIIGYLVYNALVKKQSFTSPFAGIMALSMICLIVFKSIDPAFDFYDDELITNLLKF